MNIYNEIELNTNMGKGTYFLIFRRSSKKVVIIGKLGKYLFHPGNYAYVGSAFGPGGLTARLNHHLEGTVRPHWHIDYLLRQAQQEQVWVTEEAIPREHDWAGILKSLPDTTIPVKKFGASDCHCLSHLFRLHNGFDFKAFKVAVQKQFSKDAPVQLFNVKNNNWQIERIG